MKQTLKNIITLIILISLFGVSIYIWEELVIKYQIPKRILPQPSIIFVYLSNEIISGRLTLITKAMESFRDALLGFILATFLGVLLGLTLFSKENFRIIFAPFIFITQLLPVPAFAPVVAALFGYGMITKIFIIVLFTIFPVINTVEKTIQNYPQQYFDLFQTYHASYQMILKKLIIPAIIPNLLITLKILTTASIVTSIIAELPLTISKGIGKDLYNSFNNQIIVRVWASLVIITIFSLLAFYCINNLETYILRHYHYEKS
ncbi:MAG: ABC transporter permease subunit [bacterium]